MNGLDVRDRQRRWQATVAAVPAASCEQRSADARKRERACLGLHAPAGPLWARPLLLEPRELGRRYKRRSGKGHPTSGPRGLQGTEALGLQGVLGSDSALPPQGWDC